MKQIARLIAGRKWLAIATVCASAVSIGAMLYWNSVLGDIINIVSAGKSVPMKETLTAFAMVLALASVQLGLGLISGWTCETLAHDLRMGYARYFARMSLPEAEQVNAGEQLSGLQNELGDISSYLRGNLFQLVDDAIRFIATFSWLLWLDPVLAILSNLPTVPIILYTLYSSRRISALTKQSQQANSRMGAFSETLVTLVPVLKIFDATRMLRDEFALRLDEWKDASVTEERTRARLMSLSAVLSCLPLLMLFLVGGHQVINGVTTIGVIYVSVNLSGNVSGVLMNLPGRIAAFRRFAGNMERISDKIDLGGEVRLPVAKQDGGREGWE